MHVRPEPRDESVGGVIVEDHHAVHRRERSHDLSPLGGGHDRPARSLEAAHRVVPVDADKEGVAQRAGLVEVAHVADVEEIEASVGQDQPLALPPPALGQPNCFVKIEQRRHRCQWTRKAPAG